MVLSDLIKMYLEKLIKDYCFVNFSYEDYKIISDERINHKKLNKFSENIARKLLQDSDTPENQFKKLTGTDIQELFNSTETHL